MDTTAAIGVGLIGVGGLLLYSSIADKHPVQEFASVISSAGSPSSSTVSAIGATTIPGTTNAG